MAERFTADNITIEDYAPDTDMTKVLFYFYLDGDFDVEYVYNGDPLIAAVDPFDGGISVWNDADYFPFDVEMADEEKNVLRRAAEQYMQKEEHMSILDFCKGLIREGS